MKDVFSMESIQPKGLVAASAVALSVVGSALLAPPAEATPRTVTVATGAGPINVREGAGTNTRILRTIPNGSRVTITCHVRGQSFTGGPWKVTTNIWNRLDTGGYVTDGMLSTGSNAAVVPPCEGARSVGNKAPTNTGAAGACTMGAYDKWFRATGYYPQIGGNAKDWAKNAAANGWSVVLDAQPRSIVVFQPGVHGADRTYGHVGWVERTESRADGLYVVITEMNGAAGLGRWSTRTVKDVPGMSYVLAP